MMIYKVHWIVDGVAEIEADSKEDAEKIARKFGRLCQKIKTFDGQVFAKSIQGTAYLPGNEENDNKG